MCGSLEACGSRRVRKPRGRPRLQPTAAAARTEPTTRSDERVTTTKMLRAVAFRQPSANARKTEQTHSSYHICCIRPMRRVCPDHLFESVGCNARAHGQREQVDRLVSMRPEEVSADNPAAPLLDQHIERDRKSVV